MVPWIITHLIVMMIAIDGGVTAAEILGRTAGSVGWALFYGSFVVLAAVHGAIGVRAILYEWVIADARICSLFAVGLLIGLLGFGLRAVFAVTAL